MPEGDPSLVVPAQLSFLAIYNPLLGPTDETLSDQIVFYTSASPQQNLASSVETDVEQYKDEWNGRLRHIGLAQGMVSFARNFSNEQPVDFVETDKARIVIHELEGNWWILASIDLTRLPPDPTAGPLQENAAGTPQFRYSSRELCPPHLLIQQLRRAHSTFLLHQDFTLDNLFQRVGRPAFCALLGRFWTKFARTWDVLLSGNPVVDVYNGIKLAVGGELGIGVGEEEWGSGERAVLEDFATRTDGLVDIVVSRFGDPPPSVEEAGSPNKAGHNVTEGNGKSKWLGLESDSRPSDGVIFSGVGGISRTSLVQVTQWMEWIYRYGDEAYGIGEDPTATQRRRQRKGRSRPLTKDTATLPGATSSSQPSTQGHGFSPGIPKPLVRGTSQPSRHAGEQNDSQKSDEGTPARGERGNDWTGLGTETFMKLLTLGYGSSWSFPSRTSTMHPDTLESTRENSPNNDKQDSSPDGQTPAADSLKNDGNANSKTHPSGRFLIGLRDDVQGLNERTPEYRNSRDGSRQGLNGKILYRTIYIQLAAPTEGNDTAAAKLQVVIYVDQPFIFAFLFDPQTPSLSTTSVYQSIRHQLEPLHKSLSASTSPDNAALRISSSESTTDPSKRFSTKDQPVYEFVYDPSNLTIRSSIPNIPDLGSYSPEVLASGDPRILPWSRVESLNIHHCLLSTYHETRSRPREVERTCKTSRGWWIIWVRLSDADPGNSNDSSSASQEAFLIRKASDYIPPAGHARGGSSAARFFRDLGGGSGLQSSRADMAPGKLVEGLGLDARRYIENLLSLNR